MLAAGWLDETTALFARFPPPGREASQAVGYAELHRVLTGELDEETVPVIRGEIERG